MSYQATFELAFTDVDEIDPWYFFERFRHLELGEYIALRIRGVPPDEQDVLRRLEPDTLRVVRE
jgi:hypothetical protein